jgi:ketosteroid isomerase-like protein
MTYAVPRSVVQAFYKAYAARDIAKVADFVADDVTWTISGPVDVLSFCGTCHGKDAALDMIGRKISDVYRVVGFEPHAMLVDGEWAATFVRLSARMNDGERMVSYRLAHFLRFRDDKIVEAQAIIDSYDAAEQVLGHHLGSEHDAEPDKELVAV